MKIISKSLEVVTIVLLILNVIIYLGTVVSLLEHWVGTLLAYGLGVLVAPIFSPAFLFLPWFEAWVEGGPVNDGFLIIWLALIICVALRFAIEKWADNS